MSLHDPKYLDQETYTQIFAKHETYRIFTPLIQDRNTLRFHLKEDDYQLREGLDGEELDLFFDGEMRDGFVTIFREHPNHKVYAKSLPWEGWEHLRPVISDFPKQQIVGVDRQGQIMRLGGNESAMEPSLGERVLATAAIAGYVYMVGLGKIWRRDEVGAYTLLFDESGRKRKVFRRIAGIAADDIYVATEQGELFHFDGKTLRETNFDPKKQLQAKTIHQSPTIYDNTPEPEQITCIACISSEQIYLGTSTGRVFKKTQQNWELLSSSHPEHFVYPIRNIASSHGRIFLVTGFWGRYNILNRYNHKFLWEISPDRIQLAEVPEVVHEFAETLDAKDEVMVLAGKRGAVLWDGAQWEVLIDSESYHTLSETQLQEIEQKEAIESEKNQTYSILSDKINSSNSPFTAEMLGQLSDVENSPKYWMSGLPAVIEKVGEHSEGFEIFPSRVIQVIHGDLSCSKCMEFCGVLTLVFGNVSAQNLVLEGHVFIIGNLKVENTIYANPEENAKLWVSGDLSARTWLSFGQQLEVIGQVTVESFCTAQPFGYRIENFPLDQDFITDLKAALLPELLQAGEINFEELLMQVEKNETILRS